jgi:P-type Cu+ transporter
LKDLNTENTVELAIEGMECPSCAMKIEKSVSKLVGVKDIKVDLGSESATVHFDEQLNIERVKHEIHKLGYKATEQDAEPDEEAGDREKKRALRKIKLKTYSSVLLSIIIIALGMKEHLSPLSEIPDETANWISLVLSTVVIFWCGFKFIRGFWNSLKNFSADMDTLIAVGTLSAYLYSFIVMLFPHITGAEHSVYFESAAMIITFILIGNYLEANLTSKTQYAIKSLTSLQSKNAVLVKDGTEVEVPIKDVRVNDTVIVKPGERIPVDGEVTEGNSSVDESMVTGEAMPITKAKADKVTGGTINLTGYLKIRTEKTVKESFLSKIITLVKDAQKSKPKIQRIADRVSSVFVPIVIAIAILTFVVWNFWIGQEFGYSLLKAVAVLIIACPCALGLATPIAVIVGVGRAAENKILFNNAEAIENINKINTIVFDKTGTLTYAKFEVTKVIPQNGTAYSEEELLKKTASIENFSEHPIAKAIVKQYKSGMKNGELYIVEDFKNISGVGVEARIGKNIYKIGGASMMTGEDYRNIYVFENGSIIGELQIDDSIRKNAKEVVSRFKQEGYEVALISGDSKNETERIANELGIRKYHYQVLPDKKAGIIEQMQKENKIVAMVGDGINDAPSLSKANLGIAIGTGQDIAIQSADIILVNGELENLLSLFTISKKTIRVIKQNLFWAFFYNVAAIPVAAGVLVPFGISVSPAIAAMMMALSDIITVIGNSLRLKYVKVGNIEKTEIFQ